MEVIPLCPDGEIGIHAVFKPQFFGVRVRLPLGTLKKSRINKTKPYESNNF